MGIAQPVHLQALPSSGGQGDAVQMYQATVLSASEDGAYVVAFGKEAMEASVGVMLPALVAGDEVLVARCANSDKLVITAVMVPAAASPWSDRAIRLQSQQSITLAAGSATLRLTAEGLARIVALTIEHDARDLVDIDAAEVRIN